MTGDFSPSAVLLSDLAAAASTVGAASSAAAHPAAPGAEATAIPAQAAPLRAPVVLLPARIAEDIDADQAGEASGAVNSATAGGQDRTAAVGVAAPAAVPARPASDPLGKRAAALAADFVAAGWDIAFYGVSMDHEDAKDKDPLRHSARGAALRVAGELAGRVPCLRLLPFDPTDTQASAASALIAACSQMSAGGVPPRCLIVAPALWPEATLTTNTTDGEAMRSVARSADIARWDSDEINQFHQANVTAPLCLARAHYAAWQAFRSTPEGGGPSVLERYAEEDASVVVLLDDVGLQRLVGFDRIPYAASQAAMHATVPSLARAFAPGMRVTAVRGALCEGALADTTLAQALCYVAEANTITGATLQLGGVADQSHRSR